MAGRRHAKTEAPPPGRAAVAGVEGTVYMFGMGDIGQLGIDAKKRKYPALVPGLPSGGEQAVEVQCGGMHTVVLLKDGTVWMYGNNDDLALGRKTPDEDDMKQPGRVELSNFIVQVTAGDMHSAALTGEGHVYSWGNFRDSSGKIGLLAGVAKDQVEKPQRVKLSKNLEGAEEDAFIKKIASGSNHLVMLADDGAVYTVGTGEQGQLGRQRPGGKKLCQADLDDYYLTAQPVSILQRRKVVDISAGEFSTYFRMESGSIYVCGLNNYGQLGVEVNEAKDCTVRKPTKSDGSTLTGVKFVQIAAGEHHAIALDSRGVVYSFGRNQDGRLGLGPDFEDQRIWRATPIPKLKDVLCVQVGCGLSTSYAISKDKNQLYAWGFGVNFQLATGQEDDQPEPNVCNFKNGEWTRENVVYVSAGAQHVGIIRRSIKKDDEKPKVKKMNDEDEEKKKMKKQSSLLHVKRPPVSAAVKQYKLKGMYTNCGDTQGDIPKGCIGIPDGCVKHENSQLFVTFRLYAENEAQFELAGKSWSYAMWLWAFPMILAWREDSIIGCRSDGNNVAVGEYYNIESKVSQAVIRQIGSASIMRNAAGQSEDGYIMCNFNVNKNHFNTRDSRRKV